MFHHKTIPAALAVLALCITVFAATYHLAESPAIWFDEGMYTQTALNLARYGTQGIQVAPHTLDSAGSVTGGFPFIGPISISYSLFGPGVVQGRAIMVFFLVGFVILAYFSTRLLFGPTSAAITALLLSSFPMLYGDGKSVLGEVPGFFFLMGSVIFLFLLEKSRYTSRTAYAGLGVMVGLCVVTKPIFILLLPAFGLAWLLRFRQIPLSWRGAAIGAAAFLLPIGIWIHLQFGTSDSVAGAFAFYANPYNATDLLGLVLQNLRRFFREITPLYTAVLMFIWGLSLWVRRKKDSGISTTELVLFLFSLIVIAAYMRLPGWYRYLLPAVMLALIFLPNNVQTLFALVQERISFLRNKQWIPYVLLTLMMAGQWYQLANSSYVASYYRAHRTEEITELFRQISPERSVFVYNAPEVVVLLPSANYYQYIKPHATDDEESLGGEQLPLLKSGIPDYVVIGSEDYKTHLDLFNSYTIVQTKNRYTLLGRP
ncbi:MAG: glycosyltransferase family 39 protein [Candidatus Pacebacteria bacterium]|nr:glycosyltransferase family 39 protein [Candidatus Paceibacterota bacterium]